MKTTTCTNPSCHEDMIFEPANKLYICHSCGNIIDLDQISDVGNTIAKNIIISRHKKTNRITRKQMSKKETKAFQQWKGNK